MIMTYLAWQKAETGFFHLRKFDGNGKWLKWEGQTPSALSWAERYGNPLFNENAQFEDDRIEMIASIYGTYNVQPYEVISD